MSIHPCCQLCGKFIVNGQVCIACSTTSAKAALLEPERDFAGQRLVKKPMTPNDKDYKPDGNL